MSNSHEDRLSLLPNDVLLKIVSLLPLKDGALTTILSSRYRYLWSGSTIRSLSEISLDKGSPLDYPCHDDLSRSIIEAIDTILYNSHHGPIHHFQLSQLIIDRIDKNILNGWLETLAHRSIQRLRLCCHYGDQQYDNFPDCSLFTSSPLLELSLGYFSLLNSSLHFPKLEVLNLFSVKISDESLNALLSSNNCPFLETLSIFVCKGFEKIRISLQSLVLFCYHPDEENPVTKQLVIEDAPNLEDLRLSYDTTRYTFVRIVNAPKLREFGLVTAAEVKGLEFNNAHLQPAISSKFHTSIYSVTRLAVAVDLNDDGETKTVYDLLKCFPYLVTLDIKVCRKASSHPENLEQWEQQESVHCLDHHLKTVNLDGSSYEDAHVGFIKFLIRKARVLKELTVYTRPDPPTPWDEPYKKVVLQRINQWKMWVETIHLLFVENRACADAQFISLELDIL